MTEAEKELREATKYQEDFYAASRIFRLLKKHGPDALAAAWAEIVNGPSALDDLDMDKL
jgi:hypothetical protein